MEFVPITALFTSSNYLTLLKKHFFVIADYLLPLCKTLFTVISVPFLA